MYIENLVWDTQHWLVYGIASGRTSGWVLCSKHIASIPCQAKWPVYRGDRTSESRNSESLLYCTKLALKCGRHSLFPILYSQHVHSQVNNYLLWKWLAYVQLSLMYVVLIDGVIIPQNVGGGGEGLWRVIWVSIVPVILPRQKNLPGHLPQQYFYWDNCRGKTVSLGKYRDDCPGKK